jgi:glycosyltransferase involved in cell wall biosynthesis
MRPASSIVLIALAGRGTPFSASSRSRYANAYWSTMRECVLLVSENLFTFENCLHLLGKAPVLNAQLLFIGGEDQHLRIPFMVALRHWGFRVRAAGSGDAAPFEREDVEFRPLLFKRFISPLADLVALRKMTRLIRELRPDIVQCFDTKPNVLVPLAARNIRGPSVVRTINGLGWCYSSRSPIAATLRPIYRMLHRAAARSTAATVFQNQEDQTFFELNMMVGKGGGRLICGSGIDAERFERAAAAGPSPTSVRQELGLGSSEVVITVSRITRQKGISSLLKAAALVHEVRSNVRFLLVGPREGEGPWALTQAEIDHHAPYVLAIGPRDDVPALLRVADIFAFPTEYREGVPRALLEAALSGLPIVATQMPGCRDVVRDGETGVLVPPRAPRDLANAILDLLSNRESARAMGGRAAALARRQFDVGLVVESYVALYHEVLGRSAGNRLQPTRQDHVDFAAYGALKGTTVQCE